jgi:glycerophosphoryl diester phosphodiesterase
VIPRRIQSIGHRGAAGHAPENTIAAIEKGIGLGADFVEVDIQRTRDGRLVLMHDKFVERTTNGRGRVTELNWDELRTLNAGEGERIPLLEDALAAVNGRIGIILETITPGIGGELYHATSRAKLTSPVIFSSFLHAEILVIHDLAPSAETMALMECVPLSGAAFATSANATHVGLSLDSTTRDFVVELQDSGLQVFLYTANDAWLIEQAIGLAVDGIISNFPDRVAQCIAQRSMKSA